MPTPDSKEAQAILRKWRQLADDAFDAGQAIAAVANTDPNDGARLMAMTLLARSISNIRSVAILVDEKQILEARIISRGLFENAFVMNALKNERGKTMSALQKDHARSKRRRGELIAAMTEVYSEEQIQKVNDIVKEIVQQHGKGSYLDAATVAAHGKLTEFMRFWAQLSASSVHVSLESIEYHMNLSNEGKLTSININPSNFEDAAEVLGWSIMALLPVISASQDIFGNEETGKLYRKIYSDFTVLTEHE